MPVRGRVARILAAVFLTGVLLLAVPAAAQTELVTGYPDRAVLGPRASKGAVIYSHGQERVSEGATEAPYVLDYLLESGWDVFRLQRRWAGDTLELGPRALGDWIRRLRAQGYTRIVLVGQSFGAWLSLAAARPENGAIHAVVALAPAAFGAKNESPTWMQNGPELFKLAETLTANRAAVFLFDDDEYDPGGRGEQLKEIFRRRGVTAAVVDRPFALAGHNVGTSRGFARRYGPCLRDFIETTSPAPIFACGGEPTPRASDFRLPDNLQIKPPPSDALPGLAAMLGRWYGMYWHGREIQLVIDEIGRDRALAVYAFGPISRDVDDRVGFSRRRGEFEAASGILKFADPSAENVIEVKLTPEGRMAISLTNRRTGGTLETTLRRLD